jgi:integrase
MNKKTVALTSEQYKEIIKTMQQGFSGMRPNPRVATALVLEANLGLRICDILKLRLSDIIKDGDRYRLDITEQKTGKKRTFTVPSPIYLYIENYCLRNQIGKNEQIFPISSRTVQSILKMTCDYLGYEGVSTHSFRKWYATSIYNANGYDIALVQYLLQHSSPTVTQRYIGVAPRKVEEAILGHTQLL